MKTDGTKRFYMYKGSQKTLHGRQSAPFYDF